MTRYSYDSLTLLCRLINRDNPDLKQTLSAKNIVLLGGPYTTGLGTSGRNTRIKINGRTGSGIVGKAELFYDRLNIGALFNGITVVFAADGQSATVADLLPALNEQYGLGLTLEDITNGATKLGTGYTATQVTLTIASTSVAFTGALSVIWTRRPAGVYPESGPGSKVLLVGSLQEGYFGTVSTAELFPNIDLYDGVREYIDTTASPNLSSDMVWYKFALDNEIYYFPSTTVLTNVSWAGLDAAGLVKADAPYPFVFDTGEGAVFFQMRLPRFGESDPMQPVRGDITSDAARLFNKIHTSTYGTGEWDTQSPDLGSYFIWQNHRDINDPPYPVYNSQMNQVTVSTLTETAKGNWRPMLKLVKGELAIVPVRSISGYATNRITPPVLSIDQTRDPNMPVRLTNVQGSFLRSFMPIAMHPVQATPVQAKANIVARSVVTPIVARISVVKHTKLDLATTDGELSGF